MNSLAVWAGGEATPAEDERPESRDVREGVRSGDLFSSSDRGTGGC